MMLIVQARGNGVDSDTEPQCQLCQKEAMWRGRAGWDRENEVVNVAHTHGENGGDSVAQAAKPLNGDRQCL
jgi:hypothetical protein